MKKIFITYSHSDGAFVDRLMNSLELPDLDISLDKKVLNPGDSLLKIFAEIGFSNFLLPVLSTNSVSSNWVHKELAGAIVKEIEEPDFKVTPVVAPDEKWSDLRDSLPPDLKQALREKYVARFDSKPYEEVIKELLKSFSSEPDPKDLYARIQGPKSDNPFWRVRTEYFEDVNVLARSFTEPESASYDRITEVKPTLIEGGRGSGKTMILKSLEAIVNISRSGKNTFRDAKLKYLGVYCRLTQGAFATQMGRVCSYVNEDTATRLFFSELTLIRQ